MLAVQYLYTPIVRLTVVRFPIIAMVKRAVFWKNMSILTTADQALSIMAAAIRKMVPDNPIAASKHIHTAQVGIRVVHVSKKNIAILITMATIAAVIPKSAGLLNTTIPADVFIALRI